MELLLALFATFWAWESLRYAVESFAPRVFAGTRVLHPLAVAALPLYILWPNWVAALAVAGAVGLLVAVVDKTFMAPPPQQLQVPRRRSQQGLPPLP